MIIFLGGRGKKGFDDIIWDIGFYSENSFIFIIAFCRIHFIAQRANEKSHLADLKPVMRKIELYAAVLSSDVTLRTSTSSAQVRSRHTSSRPLNVFWARSGGLLLGLPINA